MVAAADGVVCFDVTPVSMSTSAYFTQGGIVRVSRAHIIVL